LSAEQFLELLIRV